MTETQTWTVEDAQAVDTRIAAELEAAQRVMAAASVHYSRRREARKMIAAGYRGYEQVLAAAEAGIEAAEAKAQPHRDEAARIDRQEYKGWTRFYLVTSSDGHIHNSTACPTTYLSTTFGWLPDVSGLDEAAAVAAHGERLCSVCFPSAPVAWTSGAAKAKAEGNCSGSLTFGWSKDAPHRTGYYTGNWATCADCGQRVTLTASYKIRSHK